MNVLESSSNSATDALKATSVADHLVEMVTIPTENLARCLLRLLHVPLSQTTIYLADYCYLCIVKLDILIFTISQIKQTKALSFADIAVVDRRNKIGIPF
jgi:hypothetical protein